MNLSGWGSFPNHETQLYAPRSMAELATLVKSGDVIARGNGRAYGDSAIGSANTIDMRHINHMIAFDSETGRLEAEAGVLLGDILDAFLPRGWFPAVTPGTKFVTVGGMIAADIHGKNHHRDGSIRNFVDWIEVMNSNGKIQRCSQTINRELFGWTIGGMGLTGVIVRAAIRLKPVTTGWVRQRTLVAKNLNEAIDIFETNNDADYSVAWIDCLSKANRIGRSLVMLGQHACPDELNKDQALVPLSTAAGKKVSIPFHFPGWVLNGFTVRTFNSLYYHFHKCRAGERVLDWDKYFYPLDAINGWNRIYGRKGFLQYQCVFPLAEAREGLQQILETIASTGTGSFLAVLKRFGEQGDGFSFPMKGYSLALDFAANRKAFELMSILDEITAKFGGRLYLAKDGRLSANVLHAMDGRSQEFAAWRKAEGLHSSFLSAQSKRLGL